jgi:hypothetical protein
VTVTLTGKGRYNLTCFACKLYGINSKIFSLFILFLGGCLIRLESSCILVNMVYKSIEFPNDEDRALLHCPVYSMLMTEGLILVWL